MTEGNRTSSNSRRKKIEEHRKSLPIASCISRLIEEVEKNSTLIIVGETGSGKTTQLPQYLFKAGYCRERKMVGITQPRRIAAMSVAKRVAEECNVELGQKVGYSVRFDDTTCSSTKLKYMTEGILVRELGVDSQLSRYSVIVIDEAHERSLNTDILLPFLKKIQQDRSKPVVNQKGRPVSPLKLIIMSASLDVRVFSEYFGGAKVFTVRGRQFPVEWLYTPFLVPDYVEAALDTILQIHEDGKEGDILVFLTGQDEIESVERLVQERIEHFYPKDDDKRKLLPVPIFSALPSEHQMRAFAPAPPGFRKVILATNIAETSITIPGIKYVIDPGVVKAKTYNPRTGMESLCVVKVSKEQTLQRSGRAGREGPGKCFFLYPEEEFQKLKNSTTPEIKRRSLSYFTLLLKAMGIDDIHGCDFIKKPSRDAIVQALYELFLLGALRDDGKLSPVGYQMSKLPMDPVCSKALILANQFKCLEEMLITVAMLTVESVFYDPPKKREEARSSKNHFASVEGDHLTYLNVYRELDELLEKKNGKNIDGTREKWCKDNFVNSDSLELARETYRQFRVYVEDMGFDVTSCGKDMVEFRRCLAASFFLRAAQKQLDGTYKAIQSGEVVHIHPSSVLFHTRPKPDCVIFGAFMQTSKKYIKILTRIDSSWLTEFAPNHYYTSV